MKDNKILKCGVDPKSHLFQPLNGMQASTSVQNGEINCVVVHTVLRTEIQLESSSPTPTHFFPLCYQASQAWHH